MSKKRTVSSVTLYIKSFKIIHAKSLKMLMGEILCTPPPLPQPLTMKTLVFARFNKAESGHLNVLYA